MLHSPVACRDARRIVWRLALLAVCLTGPGTPPTGAQTVEVDASPVEITDCGQVVLTDAVLARDLVCETRGYRRAAIEIGASDITVDLGGHVVFGYPRGTLGIGADGFDGVTIRNGTIDGFLVGVAFADNRNAKLADVTIRNLESDDPDEFVSAVGILASHDALVRDSSFEFLPVFHKNGLQVDQSDVSADGIEMLGGSCGVDINFGSTGSVIKSRFVGAVLSGVLIQNSAFAMIADNEFAGGGDGISVDPRGLGLVTGITIEGNSIHGASSVGVHLMGNSDSTIVKNVIRDSWLGIALDPNQECPDDMPGPDCFYATDNVITENVVVNNRLDLYHHEHAVGNLWWGNACKTKEGAEIPECVRSLRRGGHRLQPAHGRPQTR